MAPQAAGGRLYSDTLGRLSFVHLLLYSLPVGMHHLLMDPMQSTGFKFVQMMLTPTLLTVFTIAASMEIAGRLRVASSAGFRLCLGSAQLTAFANGDRHTDRGSRRSCARTRSKRSRNITPPCACFDRKTDYLREHVTVGFRSLWRETGFKVTQRKTLKLAIFARRHCLPLSTRPNSPDRFRSNAASSRTAPRSSNNPSEK
jgi:hypothetical protein